MAFQKTKIQAELGQKVHEHLKSIGLETPTIQENLSADAKIKIQRLEQLYTEALTILGLDLSDDSLEETPKRIAKMLVLEKMWGLHPEHFPKATVVDNKFGYDQMLTECNIKVSSVCEHHLVEIDGFAHVAYIPKGKVLGLSKFNRIVEYFSRRPQVQERLTMQISETIKFILGIDDVAVAIDAVHYCVKSRGVEDQTSYTTTTALSGAFKTDPSVRNEFMTYIINAQGNR